jgi:hypothetical protein
MGRQTVPISCDDIATYGYCAACKISFKTDNISRSKMIQIYEAHCNTKHHLNVIQNVKTEETSEDYAVQIAALVEKDIKKQEQIDVLIRAVKQLSQENMEMTERFMRAEHRYKQLQTDLFGAANKYGKDNDGLVAYKSLNERISVLEKGVPKTLPTAPIAPTTAVQEKKQEEIKYVNDDNIEEFNPYELKKKTKFSEEHEFDDDTIDKINCILDIVNAKDEDGIESIEEIEYQFEVFDAWLINLRANSKQILRLDKIQQILDELKNIALVLEKIRENFDNPKYNAENKGIQKLQKMMMEYTSKVWTINDFI